MFKPQKAASHRHEPQHTELSNLNEDTNRLKERAIEVMENLQSTLIVQELISIFKVEVNKIIPEVSIGYKNTKDRLDLQFGELVKHRIVYEVTSIDEPLGEVIFMRSSTFSSKELDQFESLLFFLRSPLRNALHYKRAIEMAHKDPVTGISNRTALDINLRREVDLALRHGQNLSLILFDIDRFKSINDRYGHLAGDAFLRGVANRLLESIRSSDAVYRYGGEEFVILLSSTNIDGAILLAERIRQAVANKEFVCDEIKLNITASLGIAAFRNGDTINTLVERADKALYQAKETGRNKVVSENQLI